jgi:hypothetical protein
MYSLCVRTGNFKNHNRDGKLRNREFAPPSPAIRVVRFQRESGPDLDIG